MLRRLGHSRSRAYWMLKDQAIASLGNFITSSLLARHFPHRWQFGAYAILMDTMFFLNSLQAALVNYPLTISGASGNEQPRRSATAALLFTLGLLPLLGLGMGYGGSARVMQATRPLAAIPPKRSSPSPPRAHADVASAGDASPCPDFRVPHRSLHPRRRY